MKITQTNAYFICSDDTSWGEPMKEKVFVISPTMLLSIYEDFEYVFREITKWNAEGEPVVDLATAKRFEMTIQSGPEEMDVKWMLGASVLEIVQRLLK